MDLVSRFKDVDLLLIGGLPASGKTTLATTTFRDRFRINRDALRAAVHTMASGKPFTFRDFDYDGEDAITQIEFTLLKDALRRNKRVVVDNTLMSVRRRRAYLEAAKDYIATVGLLFLDVDFQTCLKRNASRGDLTVPRKAMEDLYSSKQLPSYEEMYDRVAVLKS